MSEQMSDEVAYLTDEVEQYHLLIKRLVEQYHLLIKRLVAELEATRKVCKAAQACMRAYPWTGWSAPEYKALADVLEAYEY